MSNGLLSRYKQGSWNAVCDMCGRYFKAEELQRDWRGLMVCKDQWEPRHPQDFVHGVPDNMTPPWVRPKAAPNYVNVPTIYPTGQGGGGANPASTNTSAVAGIAVSTNAVSGNTQ